MGKDQYHLSAEPSAKNRLFTMYHAQCPEHERRRIVDELVNGKSSHRVLFVTVAFGIGIDCNNIHRIVHIGVRYTRLGGLAEMAFQLGLTLIIILMTFQKPVKNMPEANMRSCVQSKECKRKIILNYFDHKVPDNQLQDHTCCDFHRLHCQCENCMLMHTAEQVEALSIQDESEMTLTKQNEGNSQLFTSEAKLKIKRDMEKYRFQLQKDIGRSTVGNVVLSSGFPIEMISLVLEHLPDLVPVRKVESILSVYSKNMAAVFFSIIQKQLPKKTCTVESP